MNEHIVQLHSKRIALEQRIRTLKNSPLAESKKAQPILKNMVAMLENINQQIANEQGMAQYQMTSPEVNEPVVEYDSHPDHEVQMARAELHRAAHSAISLSKMLQHINEEQGLEGWVQAKITKAADYLDSVYHYLEYEMQHPGEEVSEDVGRIVPYAAGQQAGESAGKDSPSPTATPTKPYAGPGQASPDNPNQPPGQEQGNGQFSPVPPSGGATPVPTAPNMIKMVRVGPSGPVGAPITVPKNNIEIKQREGFQVIEDASAGASSAGSMGGSPTGFAGGGIGMQKRKKKVAEEDNGVVHCSQCGKGFSSAGLKAPHHTGFSHCKDHKGMKIVAEAKDETGPKFTGYWKGKGKPGKKMVGDA